MISVKRCNKCQCTKPLSEFHLHHLSKDGRKPNCKMCRNRLQRIARYDPYTRATQMYHDMCKRVQNQKEYSHVNVLISRNTFVQWARPLLKIWFENHPKNSKSKNKPSLDRIDSNKHYQIDNIQIISLTENCSKPKIYH